MKKKTQSKGKEHLKLLMYSLSQVVQNHWQKSDKDSRRNPACQSWEKRFRSTCFKFLVPFTNTCGVLHTYSTFKYLYSFEKRKWINRRDRQRRRSMRRRRPYSERRYSPKNILHLIFYSFSAGHCVTLMHLQNFIWSSGFFYDAFVIQTL